MEMSIRASGLKSGDVLVFHYLVKGACPAIQNVRWTERVYGVDETLDGRIVIHEHDEETAVFDPDDIVIVERSSCLS